MHCAVGPSYSRRPILENKCQRKIVSINCSFYKSICNWKENEDVHKQYSIRMLQQVQSTDIMLDDHQQLDN